MAALVTDTPGGLAQFCGGTLIRADLVVTAAHCTEDFVGQPSQLQVLLGRTHLWQAGGDMIEAAEIIQHPSYVPHPSFQSDLALIRLSRPSPLPVTRIATRSSEPNWGAAPSALAAGWGRTNTGNTPPADGQLYQVGVNVLPDPVCNELHTFQAGLDLCGDHPSGGPCFGDSGGPLMVRSAGGNLLAGVTSRGAENCLEYPGIFTRLAPYADWIFATTQSAQTTRMSGADRYVTAAGLAANFSPGVPAVYLVTGEGFADAVTAAAAAGAAGGPVLLTQRHALPAATRAQLARLAPQRLIIVGGTSAISEGVAQAASTAAGVEATRLSGADRYATAVAVAADSNPSGADTVFLAVGTSFPDAVASGPVAGGADGGSVLLTERDSLPVSTSAELARLSPNRVVILGGTAAVSQQVAGAVSSAVPGVTVTRISGPDRFATAASLSSSTFSPGVPVVYIATGRAFPDALASGPLAVSAGGPVLLVDGASVPPSVADEIRRLKPQRIVVLGGTAAIPAETAWSLDGLLIPAG